MVLLLSVQIDIDTVGREFTEIWFGHMTFKYRINETVSDYAFQKEYRPSHPSDVTFIF